MKQLKSELAALDRIIAQALSQKEITAELAPKHDEKDGEEVKSDTQQQQPGKVIDAPPSSQSQSADDKKSMVAEPIEIYDRRLFQTGRHSDHSEHNQVTHRVSLLDA